VKGNSTSIDAPTLPVATSIGWQCWSRNNSADFEHVQNLGTPVSIVRVSSALVSVPAFILGNVVAGPTLNSPSTRRVQAYHMGSTLTDTERDATYNAMATYMTAVGA
jgi:hypothetical protein